MLNTSARAVRDAVKGKLEAGQEMDLHYDHPVLLLQPMIWHEGYHHGQIKLALKLAGYRFRAAKSAKEIFLPYACGKARSEAERHKSSQRLFPDRQDCQALPKERLARILFSWSSTFEKDRPRDFLSR